MSFSIQRPHEWPLRQLSDAFSVPVVMGLLFLSFREWCRHGSYLFASVPLCLAPSHSSTIFAPVLTPLSLMVGVPLARMCLSLISVVASVLVRSRSQTCCQNSWRRSCGSQPQNVGCLRFGAVSFRQLLFAVLCAMSVFSYFKVFL